MVAKGRVVVSPLVQCLPSVVPKIIDGVSQSQPKQILHFVAICAMHDNVLGLPEHWFPAADSS